MKLLGIDVGSTHCKAGLFEADGTVVRIATRPTVARRAPEGFQYFEPRELWETVAGVIAEAVEGTRPDEVGAVGIASMAETGLLIDAQSGAERSVMLPWFDTSAQPQAERMQRESDPVERFSRTGIYGTFKASVAKLLWLREREPELLQGAVWLCASDYVAFRLTGSRATDHSLAGRTFAFRIDERRWDDEWLRSLGLDAEIFPPAYQAGTPVGGVTASGLGLAKGTPVAISGHDHVCAAVAVGAVEPGRVFDSIGTAESIMGVLDARRLGEKEYRSGLVFGCHPAAGQYYWMGGISSAGGSVEWLRKMLDEPSLSYGALVSLLEKREAGPTGLLFYPYLLGEVPGRHFHRGKAALVGLRASHRREDIAQAVLEGTAFEMETLRRSAQEVTGRQIDRMVVAGGGTRIPRWMQIRADVSGCRLELSPVVEATLLGAALLAGVGSGIYGSIPEAVAALNPGRARVVLPDTERHRQYCELYEEEYLPFQAALVKSSRGDQ